MTADEIRVRLEAAGLKVWETLHPYLPGCPDSPVVGAGTPEQWAALLTPSLAVQAPPVERERLIPQQRQALTALGWVRNDTADGDERWYGPVDGRHRIYGDLSAEGNLRLLGTAAVAMGLAAAPALAAQITDDERLALAALRWSTPERWVLPEPTAEGWTLDWREEEDGVLNRLEGSKNQRWRTAVSALAGAAKELGITATSVPAVQAPTPQPDTVAVPLPPDAPAELLEARGHLSAAIGRCAVGATALAGTRPGEELERKRAVYQWLRDIVAAALKGDG